MHATNDFASECTMYMDHTPTATRPLSPTHKYRMKTSHAESTIVNVSNDQKEEKSINQPTKH